MAATTARVTFTKTKTYTFTVDMPAMAGQSDSTLLTSATLPNGVCSIGELLAGATAANGAIGAGSWSVSSNTSVEAYKFWAASYAFVLGEQVSPSAGSNRLYAVTVAGTTGSTEPTWGTSVGSTTTSGTVTLLAFDKFATVNTYAQSTAYTAGTVVKAASGTGRYIVTTGGTSAASTPTWPVTLGGTVTSGGVTFMAIAL